MTLSFSTIKNINKFTVRGTIGQFKVINARWEIVHFTTLASRTNGPAGESKSLLELMKPMRDIVEAAKVNDMSSLLQRDLNDIRVARDLIPYLTKNTSGIGFFPAVLAAIFPKEFLNFTSSETAPSYPEQEMDENDPSHRICKYGNNWTSRQYKSETGELVSFAELDIFTDNSQLVVLDGQHRSSAFRLASGVIDPNDGIHAPFYTDIPKSDEFESELPVTIIWFRKITGDSVDPTLISRKLFVDVNTTAVRVHDSRNILLDDRTPTCVMTALVYSRLALQGFNSESMSLLHTAFDMESEDKKPVFSLFNPVSLEYALRWFCLGESTYDDIERKISRDSSRQQKDFSRLNRILSPNENTSIISASTDWSKKELKINISKNVANKIVDFLEGLIFFKLRINAIKHLDESLLAFNTTPSEREAWKKVYKGGEGLFSKFLQEEDQVISNADTSIAVRSIELKAFNNIFEEYKKNCGDNYNITTEDVRLLNLTLNSKAALTGLLMALDRVASKNGWHYDNEIELISEEKGPITFNDPINLFHFLINHLKVETWIELFCKLKPVAFPNDINPKSWPAIRNYFLRAIESQFRKLFPNQLNKIDLNFFSTKKLFEASPDYQYLINYVKSKVKAYKSAHGDSAEVPFVDFQNYVKDAESTLMAILNRAKLLPLLSVGNGYPISFEGVRLNSQALYKSDGATFKLILESAKESTGNAASNINNNAMESDGLNENDKSDEEDEAE